ncbi:MAG: DNA translocase FtsK 4TM domain-containing protein, partial [Dokdonella sp.]
MARETKTQKPTLLNDKLQRRLREVGFIVLLPIAIYLFACLWTYDPNDVGWSHAGGQELAANFGGKIGANLSDFLFYFFGALAYAFPALQLFAGTLVLRGNERAESSSVEPALRLVGGLAFFISGCGLARLHFQGPSQLPAHAGGVLGNLIGDSLQNGFGLLGATLFLLALFLIAVTLTTGLSWFKLMDWIGRSLIALFNWARDRSKRAEDWSAARQARVEREVVRKVDSVRQSKREPLKIEPTLAPIGKSERAKRETQIPLFVGSSSEGGVPPLALLDEPKQQPSGYSQETLDALSRQVEFKLKDFRIDAQVVSAHPGPVITRFELQPAPGIKGSQISSLDKDIARGLSVMSVRVVDVIPGKSVIGLEIPNINREIVYLSEILRSDKYDQLKSPLALALGKDIGGAPVV